MSCWFDFLRYARTTSCIFNLCIALIWALFTDSLHSFGKIQTGVYFLNQQNNVLSSKSILIYEEHIYLNFTFLFTYHCFFLVSASEPIYENLPGVLSNSPELVDPSFNTEDRETHVVSIKPLYKGKRRSSGTDVPSPPSKKRNRTTKFASSISKKRNSTKNLKKQKKEENSQIPLSAIPESWTPKKGFQFFGTPSFKKSKKFTAPEQDASPTQLSLFSRDKSKSKKRLPKKLEISAPLELLPPPTPENPLRRLRPRKWHLLRTEYCNHEFITELIS